MTAGAKLQSDVGRDAGGGQHVVVGRSGFAPLDRLEGHHPHPGVLGDALDAQVDVLAPGRVRDHELDHVSAWAAIQDIVPALGEELIVASAPMQDVVAGRDR